MQTEKLFSRDDVAPSWWANALNRTLSQYAEGLFVFASDPTHIKIPASPNDGAAIVAIGGLWRYIESNLTYAMPGGAAGTFDVFVTAKANNIVATPAPNTDNTDYSFLAEIHPAGTTPTIVAGTVDVYRKVASVGWDGAAITYVDQLAPVAPLHAHKHAAGGSDALLIPVVNALPTVGPAGGTQPLQDGQECYLRAGANGELWHLRYNAGSSSAHKWEFLGGSPLSSYQVGTPAGTGSGIALTGAFADLYSAPGAANPASVTAPVAGDYEVVVLAPVILSGYLVNDGVISFVGVAVGAAAPAENDCVAVGMNESVAGQYIQIFANGSVPVHLNNVSAGSALHVQGKQRLESGGAGGNAIYSGRFGLKVTPTRLG